MAGEQGWFVVLCWNTVNCLPKGRLSEAAHEIQGCSSQKCSRGGVGWVGCVSCRGGWGMSCRGGVGHTGVGWGGVCHVGVGCVIQGWGMSCRGGVG